MELSGYGLGRGIQDKGNETGMESGEAKVDTLSAARCPSRDFNTILPEFGFKNKGGTSPNMAVA
jgi:hypothetical protein